MDWVNRGEWVTRSDAKKLTLIFPSRKRQRVRRWPQGTKWPSKYAQGGGLLGKVSGRRKVRAPPGTNSQGCREM